MQGSQAFRLLNLNGGDRGFQRYPVPASAEEYSPFAGLSGSLRTNEWIAGTNEVSIFITHDRAARAQLYWSPT